MFTSFKKREIWDVSRYSRATTAKKCMKKRDARAKLLSSHGTGRIFDVHREV